MILLAGAILVLRGNFTDPSAGERGAPQAVLPQIPIPSQDDSDILRAVEKLRLGDSGERRAAEEIIRKAGARAVPVLCRVLKDDHVGLREQVASWVGRLSAKEWKPRDEAMKALVRLGRHAVPFLEEYEGAGDPEVAWRVKSVIAELMDKSGQEEADERTRDAGLFRLLGESGDPAAVPTLLKGLSAPGPEVRMAATESLTRMSGHLTPAQAEEATEKVLDLYRGHKRSDERCLLLRALGGFGSSACVKPIIQLLRDNSESNVAIKQNALAVLAATKDASAWRTLVEMLANDVAYVRYAAFRHLAQRSGEGFGYDPRLSPSENQEAAGKFRWWWEKKFDRKWEE